MARSAGGSTPRILRLRREVLPLLGEVAPLRGEVARLAARGLAATRRGENLKTTTTTKANKQVGSAREHARTAQFGTCVHLVR